jgi:hypothetical protein
MELVKPDGRVISGLPCIYHLGLAILFSEAVREDGDSYIFDPAKTVCLLFQPPQPNGQQGVAFLKGFGPAIPLQPTFLRAGKAAVFITDCTDPNILKLARQTLSGIVIASAGAVVPPGERVH